jgi:site-specific DNA-cytosine methylase
MTKFLDLFAGCGSVSKYAMKLGYEVKTLDQLQYKEAPILTFCTDVLDFKYEKELKNWVPDIIWASPPCTEYSHAKTIGVRDIEGANKLVLKTLNIIKWALKKNPKLKWIIENPQTGLLKHQTFMRNLPFVDADYCAYGLPYRKRTRFWTNTKPKLKLCPGAGACPFMAKGTTRHMYNIGNGQSKYNDGTQFWTRQKYKVPDKLLKLLLT